MTSLIVLHPKPSSSVKSLDREGFDTLTLQCQFWQFKCPWPIWQCNALAIKAAAELEIHVIGVTAYRARLGSLAIFLGINPETALKMKFSIG
jgi:hypothetical protein